MPLILRCHYFIIDYLMITEIAAIIDTLDSI